MMKSARFLDENGLWPAANVATPAHYTIRMTEHPAPRARRNWFFTLLIPASAAFAITAVALAVIPVIEDRAAQAGAAPPASAIRDALRRDGWLWLLVETGVVIVLALAAMIWDWFIQEKER